MMSNKKTRFITLDAIRGVAALFVVLYHTTQFTSTPIFTNAGLAVDLFFCLSGFVIAHSYTEKLRNSMPLTLYIKKRIIRLYPMFFAGFVLGCLALYLKITDEQTNLSFTGFISAALLNLAYLPYFSDFFVSYGLNKVPSMIFPTNGAAWSLFFEMLVNIGFGYLVTRSQGHKVTRSQVKILAT